VWNANKKMIGIIIIISIIWLDQFFKYLAIHENLPNWKVFSVIVCNPNLSLGLSLPALFFWLGWLLALIILLFLIYKFKNFFLLLVLSGTLSNLIDRLLISCVVDYLSILTFPIFNLADFFISFGFLGFLINFRFFKK